MSRRSIGMARPQLSQIPYSPVWTRCRACSTLPGRSSVFCSIESSFAYSSFIELASAFPGSGLRSDELSVMRASSISRSYSEICASRRSLSSSRRFLNRSTVVLASLRAMAFLG
jgi:hypothetical protein